MTVKHIQVSNPAEYRAALSRMAWRLHDQMLRELKAKDAA